MAAAAPEHRQKAETDVSAFCPVFMKEKERDHIATPSLTADGIFGLPLRDIFPGGQ